MKDKRALLKKLESLGRLDVVLFQAAPGEFDKRQVSGKLFFIVREKNLELFDFEVGYD